MDPRRCRLNEEHGRYLQQAIALAEANVRRGGGPFGAVVVKEGTVIAEGVNRVTEGCDPTAHAEVEAIRAACRRLGTHQLDGCVIYASCEPCPMCLGAIYWARPRQLVFAADRAMAAAAGFDDAFIYDEVPRPPAQRRLSTKHLPLPDSGLPFATWARWSGRREY
ncbi:MAG: nucleoside deaminase [Candidatus Krumholzibacteriia bacterium]